MGSDRGGGGDDDAAVAADPALNPVRAWVERTTASLVAAAKVGHLNNNNSAAAADVVRAAAAAAEPRQHARWIVAGLLAAAALAFFAAMAAALVLHQLAVTRQEMALAGAAFLLGQVGYSLCFFLAVAAVWVCTCRLPVDKKITDLVLQL